MTMLLHAGWGPRLLNAAGSPPPAWPVSGWAIPSALAEHPALAPSSTIGDMDGGKCRGMAGGMTGGMTIPVGTAVA